MRELTLTAGRFPRHSHLLCSSKYFLLRAAQRSVISIDARARAASAGYSVHSSNAMMMSAPKPDLRRHRALRTEEVR